MFKASKTPASFGIVYPAILVSCLTERQILSLRNREKNNHLGTQQNLGWFCEKQKYQQRAMPEWNKNQNNITKDLTNDSQKYQSSKSIISLPYLLQDIIMCFWGIFPISNCIWKIVSIFSKYEIDIFYPIYKETCI